MIIGGERWRRYEISAIAPAYPQPVSPTPGYPDKAKQPIPLRIGEFGVPPLSAEAARFQSWLDGGGGPGRTQAEEGPSEFFTSRGTIERISRT